MTTSTLTSTGFKHVSDGVSAPLLRAYGAGGFGLAFLTLGAILMLTAFFLNQCQGRFATRCSPWARLLTFFTLIYVYVKELSPLKRAQAAVTENKDMIDTIQQAAIELTYLASDFQSLAFKNASQIAQVLTEARPILRNIPLIGQVADSKLVVQVDDLSALIVSSSNSTREK